MNIYPDTVKQFVHRVAIAVTAAVLVAVGIAGIAAADAQAVAVNITSPSNGSFHATTPSLRFTKSTQTAVTCIVDDDLNSAEEFCATNWNPGLLSEGVHTYTAYGEHSSGEIAIDDVSFTIDRTAPAIAIGAPSVPVNTDPTITFTITDANPDQINCSLDGGLYVACGAGSNGGVTASFSNGGHSVSVEAVDKAGNISMAAANFTVDKTAPQVSVSTTWGNSTNDATPSFDLNLTDLTATSMTCTIVAVNTNTACTSSYTPIALADGNYTMQVTATDAAGNSANAQFGFSVDATAPQISVTAFTGNQTTDTTPEIPVAADDAHLDKLLCGIDAPNAEEATLGECNVTSAALTFGQHTLVVRASDTYGNVSTQNYVFTVIDPSAPPVDPNTPNGGGNGGSTGGGAGTGSNVAAVVLAAKAGKTKGSRVPVTVTVKVKTAAAACRGTVKIAVKSSVRAARAVSKSATLKVVRGSCVAKTTIKLSKKLKSKKTTLTATYAGNDQVAPFNVSKSLRRL